MFVLDASVVLSHCLAEPEFAEQARTIVRSLERTTAHVPAIWGLEIGSGLLKHERAKKLTRQDVDEFAATWGSMPVHMDTHGLGEALGATLALARKHNLTIYDASYLELAMRRHAAIATFDRALRGAAERENVEICEGN